jgi:hypothetical protein
MSVNLEEAKLMAGSLSKILMSKLAESGKPGFKKKISLIDVDKI